MKRRRILQLMAASSSFLSGCSFSTNGQEIPWETNLTLVSKECTSQENLEAINNADVNQSNGTVHVNGTISDGESKRTAELRDVDIEDTTLYIAINTISDSSVTKDCNIKINYIAEIELGEDIHQVDTITVLHNGKGV